MLATLKVELPDARVVRQDPLKPRDVAVVIGPLDGDHDVTVSMEPDESRRIQDTRSPGTGLYVMTHNGDAQGQRQGDNA
jgi:hypothetical protein